MRLRGRLARQYPRLVLVPAVNEVVPTRVAAWLSGNYNSLSRRARTSSLVVPAATGRIAGSSLRSTRSSLKIHFSRVCPSHWR